MMNGLKGRKSWAVKTKNDLKHVDKSELSPTRVTRPKMT